MDTSTRTKNLLVVILLSFIVCLVAALVFYVCCLDRTITSMYERHSLPLLNQLIKDASNTPRPYYLHRARFAFSRLIFFCIILHLIAAVVVGRAHVKRILVSFFTSGTSPLNLALFRMAVFVAVLLDLKFDASTAIWFSGVPPEMRIAPFGVNWLVPLLPFSSSLAIVGIIALSVVCGFGILGLFSRASTLLALVLSFYVFGITQFSGKVSHIHHLLWFLAILAASPCGDALSVDAYFAAIRRADRGTIEPPSSSIVYSLPLRFAAMLLGIVYFFPGFWKFWTSGLDWAFSENLKYQMYAKWIEFNGWTPFFRLDRHAWLSEGAALFTLSFEMSFIFLIFFPRLRPLAAIGGVIFHLASWLFLQIFFYDLMICYVALFDWSRLLTKLGRKLFPVRLRVFYEGSCHLHRRTIAVLRAFDVMDCMTFIDIPDDVDSGGQALPVLDDSTSLQAIRAVSGNQVFLGVDAYRAIAIRTPMLWLFVPFLYLSVARNVAPRIYHRISRSRSTAFTFESAHQFYEAAPTGKSVALISIVGILLVLANSYCGTREISSGWPFACYPTFASILDGEMTTVEVTAYDATGRTISITNDPSQELTGQRFQGLSQSLLRMRRIDESGFQNHMTALCELYATQDPRIEAIRVYRVRLCTIPEQRGLNPLQRELIFEMAR